MTQQRRREVAELAARSVLDLSLQPAADMTDDLRVALEAPVRPKLFFPGPVLLSIAASAALVCLICTALIKDMRFHGGCYHEDGGRIEVAKLTVTKYANEAYPAWAAEHRQRGCPASLSELAPYLDGAHLRDPWGRDYVFTCGDGRLFVMSRGSDGASNTADDIWSHQ